MFRKIISEMSVGFPRVLPDRAAAMLPISCVSSALCRDIVTDDGRVWIIGQTHFRFSNQEFTTPHVIHK